ncbi:MAG: DUF5009 domain-containing protein [Bacteroidota bacterium]
MTDTPPARLLSLDVFRGMTIAGMVLVNNPGTWDHVYPALRHSAWNGCTPTDLVFPFFLFIVGVAITLSLSKRKERGDDMGKLMRKIAFRAAAIFAIGVALNGFPLYHMSELRIPGVLQRIAIVYFFSSLLFLKTNIKTQISVGAGALLLYWGLMTLIPVPGVGHASLEPETNLGAYIDRALFSGHLWSVTKTWDPEGLLSTLPAIGTGIAGLLLGHWLRTTHDISTKTAWIFVAGTLTTLAGIIWDIWFPINKALWTGSYVLYTAGMALLFFGTIYWLVDARRITWWTRPFVVFGLNAIALYIIAWITETLCWIIQVSTAPGTSVSLITYVYDNYLLALLSPINASLVWAVLFVVGHLGIMWVLYAKKIFIKL